MRSSVLLIVSRLVLGLGLFGGVAAHGGTPHAASPYFNLQFAPVPGHAEQLSLTFGPIYVGRTYTPEYCTDLAAGNWQPLTTTSAPVDANGRRTIVDLAASGPRKFYRVKLAGDPTPFLLTVENHWVANSGGRPAKYMPLGADPVAYNGNAGTELTGIHVFQDKWTTHQQPWLITTTEYDETGLGNLPNFGAIYANGACIGASSDFFGVFDNRVATNVAGTLTATVKNFHGRFFFLVMTGSTLHLGPPPTGAAAPFVELSDGRTIRSVLDPTAVSFDLQGRLWVTDNGPDQNVKIFDVSGAGAPTLVETFGEVGGALAGPVPGAWGEKRFYGPIGVAHDSYGNVYVGCTGENNLVMGGTDIRAFDAAGKFLWKVNGHFMSTGDADPGSDGTSVYLQAKRFNLDYAKAPGASWSFGAFTLDGFRYPDDVRLKMAMETVWVRYLAGKKFLFFAEMSGGFVYVVRFEAGSEIGIPTAFFWLGSAGRDSVTGQPIQLFPGLQPTWDLTEANKNRRWRWLDKNGNGKADAGEIDEFAVSCSVSACVDVDANGTIWYGGRGSFWDEAKDGGMTRWPCAGLDAKGVPQYDLGSITHPAVPFTEFGGAALRLRYLATSDTMFFSASSDSWYDHAIYRYDHFSDPARRTRTVAIDLGYQDFGLPVHLDQGSDVMTIPHGFTADEDYIYVGYLDNGLDARTRGEITIYDAHDGHKVGWVVPGAETGHRSAGLDLFNPINVVTRANGEKIIMVEENGAGKVMVYRWTPPNMP